MKMTNCVRKYAQKRLIPVFSARLSHYRCYLSLESSFRANPQCPSNTWYVELDRNSQENFLFNHFRVRNSSAIFWKMEKSNHRKRRQFSAHLALGQLTARKSSIPTRNQDADGQASSTRERSSTSTRQCIIKSANRRRMSWTIRVKVRLALVPLAAQ